MWLTILLALATQAPLTLPLHVHVAPAEGGQGAAVDAAWIAGQIDVANRIFAPHGLRFSLRATTALPEARAVAETRRDRDALGAHLTADVINVFVVRRLRDIHDPSRLRQGVHWRPFGRRQGPKGWIRHQVIVAAYAGRSVLAHELGHFFGHPKHTRTQNNLMSYNRGRGLPFLDAKQGRRMRRWGRRFVRTGEIEAIKTASPLPELAR